MIREADTGSGTRHWTDVQQRDVALHVARTHQVRQLPAYPIPLCSPYVCYMPPRAMRSVPNTPY
eukprot:2794185-Rhodomonas_salina.1